MKLESQLKILTQLLDLDLYNHTNIDNINLYVMKVIINT